MTPPRPTAFLLIDGDKPQRIGLGAAPMVLGRAATADIRLNDRSLSALHCRFEPSAGGWKIVDLDSRNGTFVNEMLVKQRLLEDGDRLQVGRLRLRFEDVSEDQGVLKRVGRVVDEVHKRFGPAGLRRAARRFASCASTYGVATGLATPEEIEATRRLQGVLAAMIEERDPQAIFDRIIDTVIELTGAERGFFILSGEAPEAREVVAARNFDHEAVQDALAKVSLTVQRRTLETGDPQVIVDAVEDERFSGNESIMGLKLRSVLTVPVRGPKGPIGLIYLDNRFERGAFDDTQLPLLRMFADQAAIALRNAELHAENDARVEDLAQAKAEVEELNRILADRVARTSAELQEVKGFVLREQEDAPLKYSYSNIVGTSRRMRELFHLLDKVTESDVPVLIQGESGTGKELVARAIHFNGPRKNRAFVSENCAAIPETLLESELFGYMKGAFTGATANKKGLFETANGGTLFLDEIGDMDMSMQKKLLRALQEGEIRPVGGERTVRVDVRILAASNQDLRKLCAEGRFREDLFYRLNVITVELPPLRDRREDIPLLVERFLDEIGQANAGNRLPVSEDAMDLLVRHDWPGNVRELRNEIHRAAALSDKVIVPLVLSTAVRRARDAPETVEDLGRKPLKEILKEAQAQLEERLVREALRRTSGRKASAARLLGISRPTLESRIESYHVDLKRP